MATVRAADSYTEGLKKAVNGQIADMATYDADAYVNESATAIQFGRAVQRGVSDNECKPGIAAGKFVGVSVKDPTRAPDDSDSYAQYSHVIAAYRGDIWVEVEAGQAVAAGADVSADAATGALSSAAAGAGQIAIAGARWLTSVGAADTDRLAIVRLTGELS